MRPGVGRRTPAAVIELVRSLSELDDAELVRRLAAEGLKTGGGRPFDRAAVHWVRYAHKIPSPPPAPLLQAGELTVDEAADRLGIAPSAIYYWVRHGYLDARRGSGGRLCVRFSKEVEEATRLRVARSTRIKPRSGKPAVGGAV
jgi:excisionase family DNA binding protein